MVDQQLLKEFFEEQLRDTSQLFLYKDKKLLKENKLQEYAEGQLKKAKNIFWSMVSLLFICSWFGVNSLIEYGMDAHWLSLCLGLFYFLIMFLIVFYAAKEYYVVKSSMVLLLKILERNKTNAI